MTTNNLHDCVLIKDMTAAEAAAALQRLAATIRGPVGLGIWAGTVAGKLSRHAQEGDHVAVFRDSGLMAPFGPRGDEESEACAALFAIALTHANTIAAALAVPAPATPGWTKLADRLPDPKDYERVLVFTEGSDFAGQQVFDVQSDALYACHYAELSEQPEVCQHATHWAPRPCDTGVL